MKELHNFDLRTLSAWGIGGTGRHLFRPETVSEFVNLVKVFKKSKQHFIIVGNGSNIFFSDAGLNCPVVQLNLLSSVEIDERSVYAQTGAWVPNLAFKSMRAGLSGFEHICGIPGTVGGLICMNGGSMRQSISDRLSEVRYIDNRGELAYINPSECGFDYRKSIFQKGDRFIVDATFELDNAVEPRAVRREMLKILKNRRSKFPRKTLNCGSVFKSDARTFKQFGAPGKLIESLNLKGFGVGGAKISDTHGNFFINTGNSSSQDMCALIEKARNRVFEYYGVLMQAEVRYVSKRGEFVSPV